MKRIACVAVALLLASCGGKTERSVNAVIEAKLDSGDALVTCKQSSSGTCHALFVTETRLVPIEVKAGEAGSTGGLTPDTRYCVDAEQPDPGKCQPRALVEGEQIYRGSKIVR